MIRVLCLASDCIDTLASELLAYLLVCYVCRHVDVHDAELLGHSPIDILGYPIHLFPSAAEKLLRMGLD